jgi:hypothetical protein
LTGLDLIKIPHKRLLFLFCVYIRSYWRSARHDNERTKKRQSLDLLCLLDLLPLGHGRMDKAHRRAFIQISPGTGIALQQDENKGIRR